MLSPPHHQTVHSFGGLVCRGHDLYHPEELRKVLLIAPRLPVVWVSTVNKFISRRDPFFSHTSTLQTGAHQASPAWAWEPPLREELEGFYLQCI